MCTICLTDFKSKDKLKTLPCNHSFHERYYIHLIYNLFINKRERNVYLFLKIIGNQTFFIFIYF